MGLSPKLSSVEAATSVLMGRPALEGGGVKEVFCGFQAP